MRPDQQETTPYTLTADCAVLDNAQTILLSGQMRANLIDFHTGEPIMLRAADNTYIWTDFSDGYESTGPIFMLETNPAIVNDLGKSFGSEGFSFGLEGKRCRADIRLSVMRCVPDIMADILFRMAI